MTGPFEQSPLDHPTLDPSPAETSAIRSGREEQPRFQLSREMKILLGVLALGAAVTAWYVLSGAGTPAADPTVAAVPPASSQPATNPPAGQVDPNTAVPGATASGTVGGVPAVTPGTGTSSAASQPGGTVTPGVSDSAGGPVDVTPVPFLDPEGRAGDGTSGSGTEAAAPAGINPADPLAAVPTSNPFQPLTVVNTNLPVASTAVAAAPTTSTDAATLTPASRVPQSSASELQVAGAVPLPNVPVAGLSSGGTSLTRTPGAAVRTPGAGLGSGGAIPLPNVPLGGVPTAGTPGTTAIRPLPTSVVPVNSVPVTTVPVNNGQTASATLTPPPAKPIPAAGSITPGLSTPSLGSLPLDTAPAASTGDTTATVDAAALNVAGEDTQPGVISQYGLANAPAVATVSPLDQLVQARSLVFNAVVLGPINTAIFKTDKGFVVVPTGQVLPDSTVTLKEVTATSATLSLGNETKILELDKR